MNSVSNLSKKNESNLTIGIQLHVEFQTSLKAAFVVRMACKRTWQMLYILAASPVKNICW